MKTTIIAASAAATMLFSSFAFAELPPWLNVSGSVNFDGTSSKQGDGSLSSPQYNITDAELKFEILAREGVKLVVKAELERVLNKYLKDEELNSDLEKMIEEAYIEIQTDKLGLPRAIVTVGKQRMAFGQKLSQLPMFKDSLLYKLNNEEEMIGLTVALPENFFKIVDSVAISLFETGAGDFKISEDKGVSVQLSKQLTQQIQMQVSAMMKQHGTAPNETRASLGLVYTADDGSFQVYTEGMILNHVPEYMNSKYAGTVGVAVKMGKGVVVIEASTLQNVAKEIALAYNLPVGANLVLSPEVRLVKHENGDTETVVGIRARLQFGHASNEKTARPR